MIRRGEHFKVRKNIVSLFILNVFVILEVASGASHNFDKASILSVLKANRESIQSYHYHLVRSQSQLTEDTSPDGQIYPDLKHWEEEYAVYGNKRRYVVRDGVSDEKLGRDRVNVWDGNHYKYHEKTAKLGGIDLTTSGYDLTPIFSPITFAMLSDSTKNAEQPDFNIDLVAILGSEFGHVEPEMEMLNGVECVVVTLKYKDQVEYKVWLDPNRGFAVLQRDHYIPKDYSKLWYRIRNLDFQDCGNGLWLPMKTEKTKCLYKGYPEEQWGKTSLLSTFAVSKIQINEDLPDELFDIQYPDGTLIIDRVAGITYRMGMERIDDMLDEVLNDFVKLQKETNIKVDNPICDTHLDKQSDYALSLTVNKGTTEMVSRKHNCLQWAVVVLTTVCALSAIAVITQKKKMQKR